MKAPPKSVVTAAWSGFYVGGHVGYAFGKLENFIANGTPDGPLQSDFLGIHGATGGALGGFNFMVSPRFLLGVEADWSASNARFDFNIDALFTFVSMKQTQAYSIRGRAGFLVTPNALLYGTAGFSRSKFEGSEQFVLFLSSGQTANWMNGVQFGAGMEVNLGGNWGGRVEYLHTYYRSATFFQNIPSPIPMDFKPSIGVGRAALIYRFAHGQPTPWTGNTQPTPWTGVYAGGLAGASAGVGDVTIPLGAGLSPMTVDAGAVAYLPTPVVGANLQVAQHWVVGLEAEAAPAISTKDIEVGWWGAVRGRLGYLITNSDMIYASAGWVTTTIKTTRTFSNLLEIASQRLHGLQVGGGLESALDLHWRLRFEYLYTMANKVDDIPINVAGFTGISAQPSWHTGRIGVVYLITP